MKSVFHPCSILRDPKPKKKRKKKLSGWQKQDYSVVGSAKRRYRDFGDRIRVTGKW